MRIFVCKSLSFRSEKFNEIVLRFMRSVLVECTQSCWWCGYWFLVFTVLRSLLLFLFMITLNKCGYRSIYGVAQYYVLFLCVIGDGQDTVKLSWNGKGHNKLVIQLVSKNYDKNISIIGKWLSMALIDFASFKYAHTRLFSFQAHSLSLHTLIHTATSDCARRSINKQNSLNSLASA